MEHLFLPFDLHPRDRVSVAVQGAGKFLRFAPSASNRFPNHAREVDIRSQLIIPVHIVVDLAEILCRTDPDSLLFRAAVAVRFECDFKGSGLIGCRDLNGRIRVRQHIACGQLIRIRLERHGCFPFGEGHQVRADGFAVLYPLDRCHFGCACAFVGLERLHDQIAVEVFALVFIACCLRQICADHIGLLTIARWQRQAGCIGCAFRIRVKVVRYGRPRPVDLLKENQFQHICQAVRANRLTVLTALHNGLRSVGIFGNCNCFLAAFRACRACHIQSFH